MTAERRSRRSTSDGAGESSGLRTNARSRVGKLKRGKEFQADVVAYEQPADNSINGCSACLRGEHRCLNFRLEDLYFDRPLMTEEKITYAALFGGLGGASSVTIKLLHVRSHLRPKGGSGALAFPLLCVLGGLT
jgi:hypothetical protein